MKAVSLKPQESGLDDWLDSAEQKSSKSKSKVATLPADSKTIKQAEKVAKLKEEYDCLKTIFEMESQKLIEAVSPLRTTAIKQNGYASAFQVERIVLTWTDKYSKIPVGQRQALEDAVGNMFEQYFKVATDIKVKPEMLAELVKVVGPEFFEVERYIKPTSRFTQDFATLKNADTLVELGVKQYKPAVKVK